PWVLIHIAPGVWSGGRIFEATSPVSWSAIWSPPLNACCAACRSPRVAPPASTIPVWRNSRRFIAASLGPIGRFAEADPRVQIRSLVLQGDKRGQLIDHSAHLLPERAPSNEGVLHAIPDSEAVLGCVREA